MLTIYVLRSSFIPVIQRAVIRVLSVIRRGYHLPLSQPSTTAAPERRATGWLSALRQCPIRTEGARSGGAESHLPLAVLLRAGRREIRPAYFRDGTSHALASGRYRHRGLPLSIPSVIVITAVINGRCLPVAIITLSPSAPSSRHQGSSLPLSPSLRNRYQPSSSSVLSETRERRYPRQPQPAVPVITVVIPERRPPCYQSPVATVIIVTLLSLSSRLRCGEPLPAVLVITVVFVTGRRFR